MFKLDRCISVANLVDGVSKLAIRSASSFLGNKPFKPLLQQPSSLPQKAAPALSANLKNLLCVNSQPQTVGMQVRHNWGYKDRMMLKDIKRREILRQFAPERVRLQALRANTILPKVLKKSAEEQLQSLTRHSTLGYITNRCSLTSKAGGCLHRWRLSRIVWRSLADYNQMSGVQRSTWGTPSRNAAMFTFRKQKKSWFNFDGFRQIAYTDTTGATRKQRFRI